ncbi:hypothetical protein F5B22DRAFT_7027 [Xylaria bambusicola]|uniref:uncharacterized protein n=1 Tax=Xylaria bambusicola TaxID=326684 RepID=UPI0020086B51|nr:uncharacterized protein F5B22DRAFT_7027 [Xylaria bambusicola]KAI0527851.1 hypothetical protein F5B22DRAFT_7027 [Xylaria bambusicola]
MADSLGGHSSRIEQVPLDANQHGQAQNIIGEQKSNYGNTTQVDIGSHAEAQAEQVKDQVDGATPSGPKRATPESGGRVQVGETGDLHDLAARRQP